MQDVNINDFLPQREPGLPAGTQAQGPPVDPEAVSTFESVYNPDDDDDGWGGYGPFDEDAEAGTFGEDRDIEQMRRRLFTSLADYDGASANEPGWVLRSINHILGKDPLEVLQIMEPLQKRRAELKAEVERLPNKAQHIDHERKVVLARAGQRIRQEAAERGQKTTEAWIDQQARVSPEYAAFMNEFEEFLDYEAKVRAAFAEVDAELWRCKDLFQYLLTAIGWARSEAYTATR